MNEPRRQAYLAAMGIQSWFPRFVLPAAKPSPIYHALEQSLPKTSDKITPENPSASSVHRLKPEPNSTVLNKEQYHYSTEHTSAVTAKQVTTQSNMANDYIQPPTAKPFRIMAISMSDEWLVVTDLPVTGSPSLSTDSARLLKAITYSLGWHSQSIEQWTTRFLTWPFVSMPQSLTEKDASEAVQGFLENQFGLYRRKGVLLLGQCSARYTLGNFDTFEKIQGTHQISQKCQCSVSFSVDQMLKVPLLKADVWKDIAPLYCGLH